MPAIVTHSGTLAANETWTGGTVHVITGDVTIPAGITLTIEPEVIVKFEAVDGETGGTCNRSYPRHDLFVNGIVRA